MDLEHLYTGIKVATTSGPEGNPLAARDGARLGNLFWLNVWAWGHCLTGVRDRSGGINGELSIMGPLESLCNRGSMALYPSKVFRQLANVPVVNRLLVSEVIDKLVSGQVIQVIRGR